jgi:CRP/FNR family cyclic AMP-dependent transcriptional regulator
MDDKVTLLGKVPLLAGLSRKELVEVGRLCDEVDMAAGRVLMRQGETGQEFFLIVDGRVRIERDGLPIRSLGPGDFLGEIALVDHGRRTATATSETPCRLLVVGHREFNTLLDEFPAIQRVVLTTLAQRVRALDPNAAH